MEDERAEVWVDRRLKDWTGRCRNSIVLFMYIINSILLVVSTAAQY